MYINFKNYRFQGNEKYITLPNEVCIFLNKLPGTILHFDPFKVYNLSSGNLQLSLKGIRTANNQWHLLECVKTANGAFGTVFPSTMKIVIEGKTARLYPINDIVKEQNISQCDKEEIESRVKESRQEAQHQKNHRIKVPALIYDKDHQIIYTVMENRGLSLDKLLPGKYSFNQRLEIALGITNELLLLEQEGVVHRDLKPANICLQQSKTGHFTITLIDFGLSAKIDSQQNYDRSGTRLYMSNDRVTTYASDCYALSAILGEVFTCPNIFNEKLALSQINTNLIYSAKYSFTNLFQNVQLPSYIDQQLVENTKDLLNALQAKHPEDRPSISCVNKFLLLIPYRQQAYKDYQNSYDQIATDLSSLYTAITGNIDISKIDQSLYIQLPTLSKKIVKALYDIHIQLDKKNTMKIQSHYEQTVKLFTENRSNQEYEDPFPSLNPELKDLNYIRGYLSDLSISINKINNHQFKFGNSNSSGIVDILAIIQSNKLAPEKLDALIQIGQDKTSNFLSNLYSRSSFFGKGRQKNLDLLYSKLANIDFNKNVKTQLEVITTFIENSEFQHEASCFSACFGCA